MWRMLRSANDTAKKNLHQRNDLALWSCAVRGFCWPVTSYGRTSRPSLGFPAGRSWNSFLWRRLLPHLIHHLFGRQIFDEWEKSELKHCPDFRFVDRVGNAP